MKFSWDNVGLGTKSDRKIAAEVGVHPSKVRKERECRGILSILQRPDIDWDDVGLGINSDRKIAADVGVHHGKVRKERRCRGILSIRQLPDIDWDSLPYGQVSDAVIARKVEISREVIRRERVKRKIPSIIVDWDNQPLGEVPDRCLAQLLNVNPSTVHEARVHRGIPRADLQWLTTEEEPANYPEALIDLYWHSKGVKHSFQPRVGPYIPDWIVNGKIIEYAGFVEHKIFGGVYEKRLCKKIDYYKREGWEVEIIRPSDLRKFNLGLVPKTKQNTKWNQVGLGERSDADIARDLGITRATVRRHRERIGIKPYKRVDWSKASWELSNAEIAEQLKVTKVTVWKKRKSHVA